MKKLLIPLLALSALFAAQGASAHDWRHRHHLHHHRIHHHHYHHDNNNY